MSCPLKANTVLFVDSYGILTASIAFQQFQMISRRNAKIIQRFSYIKLKKLA